MQVAMLASAIKKGLPCSLRRISACVTYRNKPRTKISRYCNESNLLSTSLPNFAFCRPYNTESDVSLPMLVDGAPSHVPSILTPLKLLYLSVFKITPHIDKEFDVAEFMKGAKYATIVISKALSNKDYESLEGLVTQDMIEILRLKIETLSPNQRQLIAVDETDIIFYILSDIAVTVDEEHSIQITTSCHYIQGLAEKKSKIMSGVLDFTAMTKHIVCNYTFTRKYVNNIGGPWIASFVNHYTML
ncbi:m-AAA protease-interacting protein 1, mitochondrial [Anoplolepis gracilipes]|uniref:m-AAA protease-interacting protein 1, mitochondrial n=1 Tax=Anoplolepis gracilipes TaxID=354296 RepID=UPI003B9F5091